MTVTVEQRIVAEWISSIPGQRCGGEIFAALLAAGVRVGAIAKRLCLPIRIMGEDFTLYRGAAGRHMWWIFVAPSRHAMSVGWVEQECIRCFYHGWKYDGTDNVSSSRRRMKASPRRLKFAVSDHEFSG